MNYFARASRKPSQPTRSPIFFSPIFPTFLRSPTARYHTLVPLTLCHAPRVYRFVFTCALHVGRRSIGSWTPIEAPFAPLSIYHPFCPAPILLVLSRFRLTPSSPRRLPLSLPLNVFFSLFWGGIFHVFWKRAHRSGFSPLLVYSPLKRPSARGTRPARQLISFPTLALSHPLSVRPCLDTPSSRFFISFSCTAANFPLLSGGRSCKRIALAWPLFFFLFLVLLVCFDAICTMVLFSFSSALSEGNHYEENTHERRDEITAQSQLFVSVLFV